MKKIMRKLSALIIGALLTIGAVCGNSLDSYAAIKTVSMSTPKAINGITYVNSYTGKTQTPTAYLYAYNAKGGFVTKYPLKVNKTIGGNFKFSLGNTKIDDKKVSKVLLQVKNDVATVSSSRYTLKSGELKIVESATGNCFYLK